MPLVEESPACRTDNPDFLQEDPRWQLVIRILATPDFSRSPRLSEFLRYVCHETLIGAGDTLNEQRIGEVVFGRPPGYDSSADSIVRSHALRLRQRLDQYFASTGKQEIMRLLIPRGAYDVVFEPIAIPESQQNIDQPQTVVSEPELFPPNVLSPPQAHAAEEQQGRHPLLPWVLTGLMSLLCIVLAINLMRTSSKQSIPPWPLSSVFDGTHRTQIVLADANYGMQRIISQQEGSLGEYLSPDARQRMTPAHPSERELRMTNYIENSNLTSYADATVVSNLTSLPQMRRDLLSIRSARDLRLRDLEDGNYIFVGSPGSNPWVSLYQDKLNFKESEGAIGGSKKFFINEHPRPGEQQTYQGLEFTGSAGEDYATISLLPASSGHGVVLILQGLQQEGTEAAGLFLASEDFRKQLKEALGIPEAHHPEKPVYFEVLIRTQTIAGASNATSIVATRLIPTRY